MVDLLRRAPIGCTLHAITITGGHSVTAAEDGIHVPKKELVSVLQVLLQSRRLKIAPSLPDARVLIAELANFKVKITLDAHETFGAVRARTTIWS